MKGFKTDSHLQGKKTVRGYIIPHVFEYWTDNAFRFGQNIKQRKRGKKDRITGKQIRQPCTNRTF